VKLSWFVELKGGVLALNISDPVEHEFCLAAHSDDLVIIERF